MNRFSVVRLARTYGVLALLTTRLVAQSYTLTGTNPPGGVQDFPIVIPAAVTNLALSVSGSATTYSHLLLRAGAAPSDTTYDFIAALEGGANAINLELPELRVTNYVLRVRTPAGSLTHAFTVNVTTNAAGFRSASLPATKPLASTNQGTLNAGGWHYYRVEIGSNLPGWRVLLGSAATLPDLYIQRDALPTTSNWLKRSQALTNDVIAFAASELVPGAYYIGVHQPSGSNPYTLRTEVINFTTLAWDPGATHAGTEVYTHANTNAGDYYFKLTSENTALGAWRTALNVTSGEAQLYLGKGTPPGPATNLYKSERIGSDGFVIPASAFSAGEDWYFLVRVETNAQWNLVSGEPFVGDLGNVAVDGSSGSGAVPIGAEGMRYFKTTVPANSLAWRLGLNGLNNSVLVRKAFVPLTSIYDLNQPGQMLVVPPYLVGGLLYFVGVSGAPGTVINLDSRQQPFTDLAFGAGTNLTVTGYGYSTYRVQVPPDQLAWQINVGVTNGNPNLAVRRSFVPNENYNDAYSEVAGTVSDSITLVPPTLSDGTFYITVYGTNSYTCRLQNGTPEFTEINFTSTTLNTDTNRVGWRFFKVSDISQQLGALGWDLFVTNFAPGTRIALRRNAAPGIWTFRNPAEGTTGSYDFLSAADFLQRPGHQADVWYVGVFNPTVALGAFTLVARDLTAEPLAFDGGGVARVAVPAGKWQYFRVDVPPTTLGWDVRLTEVTAGQPQLVVRRELLPISLVNIGLTLPNITVTNWLTGNQWAAGADWTGRSQSADGAVAETGRILTMGYGRPVQAATYYVGVLSPAGSTNVMSYSLLSRGMGPGQAIPVLDLDYAAGDRTNTALAARDVAVYRMIIASNTPSWKVRLEMTSGDALMAVAKDAIPNITAGSSLSVTSPTTAGKRVFKAGHEHFVMLPPAGQTNLIAGTYYLLVAGEGLVNASFPTRIGTGASGCVLHSVGALPQVDLGLLDAADLIYTGALEGGEVAAFRFQNRPFPNTLGFELTLEDTVGNPVMVSRGGRPLADPGAASAGGGVNGETYGNEGGETTLLEASPVVITVSGPLTDETIMLMARGIGGAFPDATYRLRVRKLVPAPLTFDGGISNVVNQTNVYRYFQIDVPPDALGWDVRVRDVLAGAPQLIANLETLPLNITTTGWDPGVDEFWPLGANWIAAKDWTQRSFSADGSVNEDGRILAMGMGLPLEPGRYYVGVRNPVAPLPMSYTLASRGIGAGFTIPVVDVPFAGGSVTNLNVPPREAVYFRVVMPPAAASWKAKVTALNGEAMMTILTNHLPSVLTGRSGKAGKSAQKNGNEHFARLPLSPQTTLPPLTNYVAVVSEGVGTNATRIGASSSSFIFTSRGELPVIDLGVVGEEAPQHNGALEGGESQVYQFTVPPGMKSLEAQLLNVTGNPAMVLRAGPAIPNPGAASAITGSGSVITDDYGNTGGYPISAAIGNANTNLISVANPTNGIFTVVVKARGTGAVYANTTYTLEIRATTYSDIAFNNSLTGVTNHTANTWRYFRVDVPANAAGWDLRLVNVTTGLPRIVVRRDLLPGSLATTPWTSPGTATNWPTGNQWGAGGDWTRRGTSADGLINEDGRILAMGMGQPLEPGTYYVGVINSAASGTMNYSLLSRGIGTGFAIPITDISYAGGTATLNDLPAREAAYFRVQVPTNRPGWKMKLTASAGEALMIVLSNRVTSVDSGRLSGALGGKLMQKAGDEHYLVLPAVGQTNLTSGGYFLTVVSEGVNPASSTRIGSGASSFTLTSIGDVPVTDLGVVGPADLVTAETLAGGESRLYRFSVVPATAALELRLEDRVGNPVLALATNAPLPDPGGLSSPRDAYGNDGGEVPDAFNANILTVANPAPGLYALAVKARAVGSTYPNAAYTLRVRQVPVPDLNFGPELNTNGLSNVGTGQLLDRQRAYYRVVVPPQIDGQAVIGWSLDLAQSAGQAGLRVRRDALPSDTVTGMPFTANAAVVAPPFLTNGTWYVEVRGTNSTSYTLTSRALALERPSWSMPASGQPPTTPGLVAPNFGDTGVATNGVPLPGDGGIDLELGRSHYYAVQVPTNNAGLLRVQLEGISGNPDIYLRTSQAPTASHATNGTSGTMVDRLLNGTETDYGNFVPANGKTESGLTPGLWYLAIRAVDNANARYRLKLSVGMIQDLALDGGTATGQALAGTDWRYYRVQIPADAPANWTVTFNQEAGDVVMHVRDTLPPGSGASLSGTEYKDWTSDQKNNGPYGNFDAAGAYTFSVPPVRPGTVYYLGFRAKNDATFSVTSSISGGPLPLPPIIPFYGGTVTNPIPANGQLVYRVVVPDDGFRWRHTAVHSNTVQLYVENGTLPTKTAADDFRSTTANSTLDRYLLSFPWLPGRTYYLIATNTTGLEQYFSLNMNGRSNLADDDFDGMLDIWEVQYFTHLLEGPDEDFDGDGVSNLNEFLENTNPTDRNSLRPRLTVLATNGVVVLNPVAPSYAQGSSVQLTATPNAGYDFVSWGGGATGSANPLTLVMNTNRTIIPRFRVPGDDFEQRIPLVGYLASSSLLSNAGATKQSGEPNHGGTAGGKSLWWTWTAPAGGTATVSTAGSNLRNALAAYTGVNVSNLTLVASQLAGTGTNTSVITFMATAGTTYHFAVDGFGGASGNVAVNVSLPGFILLTDPRRGGDGFFRFTILSSPGEVLCVEAGTNFVSWTALATVTNVTGTMEFVDTNSPNHALRFYRVAPPGQAPVAMLMVNPQQLGDGSFRFTVTSAINQAFRVEATTNFNAWTSLATLTNATGSLPFTDSGAASLPRRSYRLITP